MTVRAQPRDAGITLVEVIIAVVVSGIFASLLAVVFANGLSAQQRATERDAATATLNAATAAITQTVRNSSDIKVSAGGQRLDARMLRSDGATWECRAWQVIGGQLRYSAGATARPAADTTWASLASGVSGTLSANASFERSDKRLSIGFEIANGDTTVTVTDGAVALVVAQAGGVACF
ncbi:prepilin-type N-terminal cleavage/methylation domain-containing protein [Microbacterium esteraromaticum]|uniref:type II secretion system protein n=1 Tax=Microbacterium esteraromaticum TaxID=57043 RepID=UPI0030B4FB14